MAVTPVNTLKNWFKTGLKPAQAQFWAWLDSFWHKSENIPSAKIEGLQELLDTKVDKKDIVQQKGVFDPARPYVFDAELAEYVSYINESSADDFYRVERWFRLLSDTTAGQSPETAPDKWRHIGTTLGEIAIEDVAGLREELDWLMENGGGGGDASTRSYSIDFQTTAMIAQEINMFGAATINNVLANNVASIHLTWSGGVQQVITPGVNNIAVHQGDVLTWEITRTNEAELATLGIHLQIN